VADPTIGLFPIESVLYAIEVKSELNASELNTAHRNAAALKSLTYTAGQYDDAGAPIHHNLLRLVTAVFAFSTDLTGAKVSEVERYKRFHGNGEPPIQQLCVVGRGVWSWYMQEWHEILPASPFQEVLMWLSFLMSNVDRISKTRGFPHMGQYWFV
jgi:hypothetical protein